MCNCLQFSGGSIWLELLFSSSLWKQYYLETKPHTEGCAKLMKEIWDSVAPEFSDLVLIEYGGNDAAISLAKNEKIALFSCDWEL